MAYEHFNLGNFDKFRFYMNRYQRGILEDDDSVLKRTIKSSENPKKISNTRLSKFDNSSKKIENVFINLPSPSQMANAQDISDKIKEEDLHGKIQFCSKLNILDL